MRVIVVPISMQPSVHNTLTTTNSKETFLKDITKILKPPVEEMITACETMILTNPNPQPHNS